MDKKQCTLVFFLLAISLLLPNCAPGQLFGPTLTPTSTITLTPTLTPTSTPTMTPTSASGEGSPVSNERWEVIVEEIYTETALKTDLIGQERTYKAEAGFVFVVVRVRMRLFDQITWKEIRGKDLLPKAILLTEDGTTFPAIGSSKAKGEGCVGDCQFLLFGEEILSEPRVVKTGFVFTLKTGDVLGKTLRFQFEDLPSIPLELTKD